MWSRLGGAAVLLCCVTAGPAAAQDFGVTAGGSFSTFAGPDKGDFSKTQAGLAGGVFGFFRIKDHLGLQPQALFVQKGAKAEAGGSTAAAKISYLEFPILLKLSLPASGDGSQVSPYVLAGGAVGVRVGCTLKTSSGGTSTSESCQDAGAEIKKTDFDLVFGAGVDIGRATIAGRVDLGLTKIDASSARSDIKNRTFYLLVGWTFRPPR